MNPFARAVIAASALLFAAAPALAAEPVESCTHKSWGFLAFNDYRFGTVNTCTYAVHVWFMLRDGSVVDGIVEPEEMFDTGVPADRMPDRVWSAAICRARFVPSPAVTPDNWDTILSGRYNCVRE